jgi:hypothetical protein
MFADQRRSKTASTYKLHDDVYRKSQEIYKNKNKSLLELIHVFSKVSGYKINISKLIYIYTLTGNINISNKIKSRI